MKLVIAGKDRTDDLGRQLAETAQRRTQAILEESLRKESDVLALRESDSQEEYLRRHVTLLRARNCVDPARFETPCRPGVFGRCLHGIRMFLWKVFRYQHEWTAARQNTINVQLAYELECERELRERQVRRLEDRVRRLEQERTS